VEQRTVALEAHGDGVDARRVCDCAALHEPPMRRWLRSDRADHSTRSNPGSASRSWARSHRSRHGARQGESLAAMRDRAEADLGLDQQCAKVRGRTVVRRPRSLLAKRAPTMVLAD
jgi:hypothetical protein